jgi:hypothetical protein
MLLDPEIDLPLKKIESLLKKVLNLYQSGIIKLPKQKAAKNKVPLQIFKHPQ